MLDVAKELAISFAITTMWFVLTCIGLLILAFVFAFFQGFTGSSAGALLVFFFFSYLYVLTKRNISDSKTTGMLKDPTHL